jgi:hypothetical protein
MTTWVKNVERLTMRRFRCDTHLFTLLGSQEITAKEFSRLRDMTHAGEEDLAIAEEIIKNILNGTST